MLRGLQHPAARSAQVAQHLELFAQERVVRALVETEVVVAPTGHASVPFERVRAQVEVDQLTVFFDRPRRPIVHQRGERRDVLHRLPVREAAEVARVDTVATGPVADDGDRFPHLPPRHGAKPRVGGEQVHEVRGTGPREPDDDSWRFEFERRPRRDGGGRSPRSGAGRAATRGGDCAGSSGRGPTVRHRPRSRQLAPGGGRRASRHRGRPSQSRRVLRAGARRDRCAPAG